MTTENTVESRVEGDPTRQLIARILYMIVFGFAFWACSIVLGLAAILQLLMVAFTRARNDNLTALGAGLGEYVREIVRYLTFVSDEAPFPFADWPATRHPGSDSPQ